MELSDNAAGHLPGGLVAGGPRLTNLRSAVQRAIDAIHLVATAIAAAAMLVELVIILSDVTQREFLSRSFLWADEAAKLALSIIAFIGGAAAYRARQHTSVRVLLDRMRPGAVDLTLASLEWIVVLTAAIAIGQSALLLQTNWTTHTPILQLSVSWIGLPLPIGLSLIALFALERLALQHRPAVAVAALVMVTIPTAAIVTTNTTTFFAAHDSLALLLMLVLFFGTVLLGLPVSFAMLLSTLIYLTMTDAAPTIAVPQNMIDGTGNFILLALPFFIFAGLIMEKGGISLRLVRFAMALVGNMRGALLQVMVVTIYLVSGISGSKIADVAAVGSVMRGEMRRHGYPPEQGAAVLAASAAMAETIPPSIAMLVLGSVTPISIGTLFVAGLLPAALIAVCLMALIAFQARGRRAPAMLEGSRLAAVPPAILPLLMPVAMVMGIRFGLATPTEVSTFAVLYGLILSVLVYRGLSWSGLLGLTLSGAMSAGMVLFVLSSAQSFAWVLAAANLPQQLVALLNEAGRSQAVFWLGSIVLLILVGTLLEGLPALIILAPLLLPIATGLGIDAVQYGIVLILAMGVGAFMPPVGIGFYVASSVAGSSVEAAARQMVPFLVVLVLAIAIIASLPGISLIVPHLLNGRS
ncbi:MAG: TRAP transporter large permease subunit [Acetobacteraceae bacterium]|nr:TRAP transporter large permease subunit [Acetobacteraceae bacterium]